MRRSPRIRRYTGAAIVACVAVAPLAGWWVLAALAWIALVTCAATFAAPAVSLLLASHSPRRGLIVRPDGSAVVTWRQAGASTWRAANLAARPRKQGYGWQVMEALCNDAVQQGVTVVGTATNERMANKYVRILGFEREGGLRVVRRPDAGYVSIDWSALRDD